MSHARANEPSGRCGEHVEHRGGVADGVRERADRRSPIGSNSAGGSGSAPRLGLNADEAAERRRDADRAGAVGARRDRQHAGGNRGGRTAARAAAVARGIVRVARRAVQAAVDERQDRQLGARGLADDHEPGAAACARDVAVDRRDQPAKRARAEPRAEAAHRLVILDRGRHAEERRRVAAREQRVGAARLRDRAPAGDLDERTELGIPRADLLERVAHAARPTTSRAGAGVPRARARRRHAISSAWSIQHRAGPFVRAARRTLRGAAPRARERVDQIEAQRAAGERLAVRDRAPSAISSAASPVYGSIARLAQPAHLDDAAAVESSPVHAAGARRRGCARRRSDRGGAARPRAAMSPRPAAMPRSTSANWRTASPSSPSGAERTPNASAPSLVIVSGSATLIGAGRDRRVARGSASDPGARRPRRPAPRTPPTRRARRGAARRRASTSAHGPGTGGAGGREQLRDPRRPRRSRRRDRDRRARRASRATARLRCADRDERVARTSVARPRRCESPGARDTVTCSRSTVARAVDRRAGGRCSAVQDRVGDRRADRGSRARDRRARPARARRAGRGATPDRSTARASASA